MTGFRYSVERSLEAKRNADAIVEVVTADDIGKLPDKNIADAVQRVPGVTISSAAGGEGGFDENDRVSIRGTNPSLTQTLINGHPVASGDWFVLDQVQTVGRSVSFSLLPSELVSQVIVRKSATADLVEGGVAGNVDIITRKPLDFRKQITGEASIQAVYADLPKETDGQFSGLINWKTSKARWASCCRASRRSGICAVMGRRSWDTRRYRRPAALAAAHPDLANVSYPTLIGSSFFEQERERYGGLVDVQVKPTNDLIIDFNAFYSHMKANELQPQLDVLGLARHQRRRRRNADVVPGDQRHADVRRVSESRDGYDAQIPGTSMRSSTRSTVRERIRRRRSTTSMRNTTRPIACRSPASLVTHAASARRRNRTCSRAMCSTPAPRTPCTASDPRPT